MWASIGLNFIMKLLTNINNTLLACNDMYSWRTPKLLNELKCESKLKTVEEQGVGVHSLARNSLRG